VPSAQPARYPKKMKKRKDIRIGIAWYREDQWQLLRSTASDSESIEDTYQEWMQIAGESIEKLKKHGLDPVKVDFDVHEFNGWCNTHKRNPNAESRSEYAAELLRKKDEYNKGADG